MSGKPGLSGRKPMERCSKGHSEWRLVPRSGGRTERECLACSRARKAEWWRKNRGKGSK